MPACQGQNFLLYLVDTILDDSLMQLQILDEPLDQF